MQYEPAHVELMDTSRLPICLDRQGREAEPGDDGSVRFHSLTRSEDGRGHWIADIAVTLVDDVAQRTVQAFRVTGEGRRERLWVYGGRSRAADGTVRLTARAYGRGEEKPKGLFVAWFRQQGADRMRFRLRNVPLR